MSNRKLLRKLVASPNNARFDEVCRLVEAFGWRLARISGSHHIDVHPLISDVINMQEDEGEAKPYQIRQLLRLVELHNLTIEGE